MKEYNHDGGIHSTPYGFENLTINLRKDYKSESDKFVKDALALQLKVLDKYSDAIKRNLVGEFQLSNTDKERRKG